MKILHIISSLEIGGAQRVRLELLRKLISQDHAARDHILLYFNDGPMREKFENIGVKTFRVNGKFLTYGWGAISLIKKIIASFKPDIIHSQLWAANIFARLAARESQTPVICDLHCMPEVQGFWRNLLERFLPIQPACYVAVSDGIAEAFTKKFSLPLRNPSAPQTGALIVIKNGVDAHKFRFSFATRENFRETFEIENDCFVVGSVGRLEPVKSFDNLIQAFAEFFKQIKARLSQTNPLEEPNLKLIIVGEGSQKNFLRGLVKSSGLAQKIIITKPTKSISRFYSLFDCFAISSKSEGLSVALLEALFAGLTVVTTTQTPEHEAVVHEKNGLLVPFADKEAMVKAFIAMYEKFNPEFQERPSLADPEFEISCMTSKYQSLYNQICQERLTLRKS